MEDSVDFLYSFRDILLMQMLQYYDLWKISNDESTIMVTRLNKVVIKGDIRLQQILFWRIKELNRATKKAHTNENL